MPGENDTTQQTKEIHNSRDMLEGNNAMEKRKPRSELGSWEDNGYSE